MSGGFNSAVIDSLSPVIVKNIFIDFRAQMAAPALHLHRQPVFMANQIILYISGQKSHARHNRK